ncbi:MAG: phospho-N-acetylmuramoyl-pentapeptide-transferase [Candidatus Sericytochromatia bacterium]|nr:phospho-N-acetylmuramoyl-pentapeptide-transferase [Candidatus Sericytochromatia bacterium]
MTSSFLPSLAYLLVAFALALAVGRPLIRVLHELKFGQVIREEGPESHKAKSGTPSMGGWLIVFPFLLTCVLGGLSHPVLLAFLGLVLAYAGLGFLDDWLIIKKRSNKGLSARQKLAGQVLIAVVFLLVLHQLGWSTVWLMPPVSGLRVLDLGYWYWPVACFIVVGSSNAVNLTDGLDGLAGTTVAIAAMALGCVVWLSAGLVGNDLSLNLGLTGALLALVGGCLGFLWFNAHPAQVFMGDTGSLALGAALGGAAILGHVELWYALIGAVFIVETLSVIAQVTYFKRTGGKRLLKMSPLHHHFELSGLKETKVVARFALLGAMCAALAVWGAPRL